MNNHRTSLLKLAMSTLHYSGAGGLLAPLTRGVGAIFMLHRVRPAQAEAFGPNRFLEVRPEFLDETIGLVLERGFDVLSLDEMHARLAEGDFDRPFACFTFDDGYRDNYEYAYPIFKRHGLPFAIYVPSDFPDGKGDLWWIKLEEVIARIPALDIRIEGKWRRFDLETVDQKNRAFECIYWWLRGLPELEARSMVSELAQLHDIDLSSLCSDLIMPWDDIRELASDPLVTIGGHTRRHLALAKLSHGEAALEVAEGIYRLEAELGQAVAHFSYPYGDATSAGTRDFKLVQELGMKTGVTTRKGLLHERHNTALTALPRVSLNGNFQHSSYVKVLLSGAPFAFADMAERLPFRRAA